jgi:hypothetical protein
MHHCQISRFPERAQFLHRRVQPDAVIQPEDLLRLDPERRPVPVIDVVGVRDHGVEAIVAAAQFDDHEDRQVGAGLGGHRRPLPQPRQGNAE